MYYRRRTRGALSRSPQPTVQALTVPASVGGVNTLDALMQVPPTDCLYTYNLMPAERGLLLRKGYREWATGCGTGDVRTVLSYESPSQSAANDRLWAVTNEGIYNVTAYGTTSPVKDVTFSSTADPAGYGVKCEFTNDASTHYLFYADGLNGIYMYEEGVGWSVPTGWFYEDGSAFDVADVVFVMVFKSRIWVILEDSDDAYYLPVASIAGTLTKFTFGAKMEHGGDLMGLWTWSVDGGAGLDDLLIGISRGGDVFVYQGNDPQLQDFGLIGSWFIGRTPNSRRLVQSYGSQMYMLSTYGVTALQDLLRGTPTLDKDRSPSAKVNKPLRQAIAQSTSASEWSLAIHPADGFMQIVTPIVGTEEPVQYSQNLNTAAWGYWEGVPMICADTWAGEYYFGGAGGKIYQYFGTADGATIAGDAGSAIEYRILTAFQPTNNHATYKRVNMIRTLAISTPFESFNVKAIYDYKEGTIIPLSSDALAEYGAIWDTSVWDEAGWDYTTEGRSFFKGASGLGRTYAVGMRGKANARIEIVGWDTLYTEGGFL